MADAANKRIMKDKILRYPSGVKLAQLFCTFIAAVALLIVLDFGCAVQKFSKHLHMAEAPVEPPMEKERTKTPLTRNGHRKRKIGYLRLHGLPNNGEDIVRIFYKLAYCTDLTPVLPNNTEIFTIGYPFHFKASLADDLYGSSGEFDIMALHARWDYEEYTKLLGKKAYFLTMMRHPVDAFVELFNETPHLFIKLYGGPIDFLVTRINLGNVSSTSRLNGVYGRNQMAWNFGMEATDFDDQKKVDDLIKHIDRTFHLVMMYEKYNESLVLLQRVLEIDTRLIAMNSRTISPVPLKEDVSSEDRAVLEKWLSADMRIYNHFRRKFDRLVEEVGEEEMSRIMKEQEEQNAFNYKTCYDPDNKQFLPEDQIKAGLETEWALPFRDVSYCRVHGFTEQSMHQDLLYINMNKDFSNIYRDPSIIYSHFHDEGL